MQIYGKTLKRGRFFPIFYKFAENYEVGNYGVEEFGGSATTSLHQ